MNSFWRRFPGTGGISIAIIVVKTTETFLAELASSSIRPILFPSEHLNPFIFLFAFACLGLFYWWERARSTTELRTERLSALALGNLPRRDMAAALPETAKWASQYGFFDQVGEMVRQPVDFIQREMQDPPGFYARNLRFAAICLGLGIILERWNAPLAEFQLSALSRDFVFAFVLIALPAGFASLLWLAVRGRSQKGLLFWNFVAFSSVGFLAFEVCDLLSVMSMDILSPGLRPEAGSPLLRSVAKAGDALSDCAGEFGMPACFSRTPAQLGLQGAEGRLIHLCQSPGFQVAAIVTILGWLIITVWSIALWRGWKLANRTSWLRTAPIFLAVWAFNSALVATVQEIDLDAIGISPTGSITADANPCTVSTGQTQCTAKISWNATGLGRKEAVVYYQIDDGGRTLFANQPSCAACQAPFIQPEHSYIFTLYVYDQHTGQLGNLLSRVDVKARRM